MLAKFLGTLHNRCMSHRSTRQDNVSRIIRALLDIADQDQAELAPVLDLSVSALSRRFSSGKWDIDDIDKLAAHFGCRISTFFLEPRDLLNSQEGGSDQGLSPTKCETTSDIGVKSAAYA